VSYQELLFNKETAKTIVKNEAVDANVAAYIRYKGAEASCLITVDSNGDLLAKVGDYDSEASDANFIYPSDGTEGTIDVSELASTVGDNFTALADAINALDDYECILGAVRESQAMSGMLQNMSSTYYQAKTASPDPTLAFKAYLDVSAALSYGFTIDQRQFGQGNDEFQWETYGSINELNQITMTPTGGGTVTLKIYGIKERVERLIVDLSSETEPVGSESVINIADNWGGLPLRAEPGEHLLGIVTVSGSFTDIDFRAIGQAYKV